MGSVNRKSPPTPPGHWLLGNLHGIKADPIVYTANMALAHKPLVLLKIASRRLYVTADADTAMKVMVTHAAKFNRGANYKRLSILGGKGLITTENGDFWKRQRRLAQPGFHKERLNSFFQSFIDSSLNLAERWKQFPEGEVVRISDEMSRFTLQVVGLTLFSLDLAKESQTFPMDLKFLLRFINQRHYQFPRLPMHWPLRTHKEFFEKKAKLDETVFQIIDQRAKSQESYEDLLDMFMKSVDEESGEQMDRTQIRDEIFTMLVAGFETSSVALTWVWYSLHQHPEFVSKILEELDKVVGDEPIKPGHLMQLTYLQQVISETMRLYPPVFAMPRDVGEDMELGGYYLKKNTPFLVSIYGLHHHPDYWPEPEKFDPERFSKENKENQVKGSYMPFGNGQRICIGSQFAMLEMTALIAVLIKEFAPEPIPDYTPKMIAAITTNVTQGMPMFIKRRKKG